MDEMFSALNSLAKEIEKSIKEFSKYKELDQKKKQAEIIKLLCESMGVFFNAMGVVNQGLEDIFDDEEEFEEETKNVKSLRKSKRKDLPF